MTYAKGPLCHDLVGEDSKLDRLGTVGVVLGMDLVDSHEDLGMARVQAGHNVEVRKEILREVSRCCYLKVLAGGMLSRAHLLRQAGVDTVSPDYPLVVDNHRHARCTTL